MNNLLLFLQRTIGQRIVLGLTGLGLCLFLLIHMTGNLLIFAGPEAYNLYAYRLHSIKIIKLFEIGLLIFFVGHIVTAVWLNFNNRKAKGPSYKRAAKGEKKTFLGDQLLVFQGLVLFVFLVNHLLTFKFGTHYETVVNGITTRDVYRLVLEIFNQGIYFFAYVFSLLVLSYHLIHGLPASLRTLGFYHPEYVFGMKILGWIFGLGVVIGFLLPISYVFFIL